MTLSKTLVSTAAIVLVMGAASRASVQQGVDPATLPEGDGKTILVRACSDCHDLGSILVKRLTPKQWKDVTRDMISRGVKAEEPEILMVIEFLAVNVGHVNVNKATEADLKTYGGFSDAEATAILAARGKGQTFQSLDDLKAIPGLDPAALEDRKDRITFKDS